VVTGFPSRGIEEKVKKEYINRRDELVNPSLRIIRVGSHKPESKNFILRALNYLINSYLIYRTAKKVKTDIYLVESTPPFLGIAGAFITKKFPAVFNLQDVFPDSLINSGKLKEKCKLIPIFRRIERFIYNKHNHIITISQDFRKVLLSRGVIDNKISVIYNWIDENNVIPINRENNVMISRYGLDKNKFYITYCGNIGYSQNLEMVVDIAHELEGYYPDIQFVFIGDGAWKDNIKKYINKLYVKTVRLIPFQPYTDISDVMSLGDLSLVCSKSNVGKSSFPSKTWSIMSAAKPVLCSFDMDSELRNIIEKANCGICVPAENREVLKDKIIYAYNHKEEMKSLGENGRKFVEENLTKNQATRKYFEVLQKTYNKSRGNINE
jgi:glycosyltransferase involved in cell wall biosynthesis